MFDYESKISSDITEAIRRMLGPKTKQDVVQQRIVMLDQCDRVAADTLTEMEQQGAVVLNQNMSVNFRYNRELSAWEFVDLNISNELNLNQPVNRLFAVYNVDPSFYDEDQPVNPCMEDGTGGWESGSDVTLTRKDNGYRHPCRKGDDDAG